MLKKTRIISLSIALLLLFSVAAHGAISEGYNTLIDSIKQKYEKKTANEMLKDVTALDKKGLMKEIKAVASISNNINALIPYADALMQKEDEIQNSEIIGILSNSTSSVNEKILMVDLYTRKNGDKVDNNDIKKLLKEKNVDDTIKSKIISDIKFDKNDKVLLKDLIKENDGVVFFHSLKKLSAIDESEAYEISKHVLSNYKTESKDKVSAALKATSKYLKNNRATNKDLLATEEAFINLSLEIINTTNDSGLKDTAVFALSGLRSKESITKIVKGKSIDRVMKSYSIDENFMQLKEILSNNPTELEIATVIDAMEILPIMDLAEELEKALNAIENNDLQKRGENVLQIMRTDGIQANLKSLAD